MILIYRCTLGASLRTGNPVQDQSQEEGLKDIVDISLGKEHVVFLLSTTLDNSRLRRTELWSWGLNNFGQLGGGMKGLSGSNASSTTTSLSGSRGRRGSSGSSGFPVNTRSDSTATPGTSLRAASSFALSPGPASRARNPNRMNTESMVTVISNFASEGERDGRRGAGVDGDLMGVPVSGMMRSTRMSTVFDMRSMLLEGELSGIQMVDNEIRSSMKYNGN